MEIFKNTCLYLGFFLLAIYSTHGQSEVEVKLITREYVERGSTIVLHCKHNVDPKVLYKVAWLKNDANTGKFFEFIVDRNPPFRNFSIPGAEIDWSNSNSEQVALKNIDFEVTGLYYCEVTTSTPIYTKASQDKRIHVILSQVAPPRISFSKRLYYIGEKLMANCTTSRARPPPTITWLINGKKVDDKYVRQIVVPSANSVKNSHRYKSHQHQQQHKQPKQLLPKQKQQYHQNQDEYMNVSLNSLDNSNSRKSLNNNVTKTRKNKRNFYNFHHSHQNVRHDHNLEYNNNKNFHNHHLNNHRINQMINDNNKYLNDMNNRYIFHKYRRHISADSSIVNHRNSNNITTVLINSNNTNNNINKSYNTDSNSSSGEIEAMNTTTITTTSSSSSTTITTTTTTTISITTTNDENSNTAATTKSYLHRGNISISQLNIEVSEIYVGDKDKLEITCLATIPAHVNDDGEEFADYKTYSIKVNVAKGEPSSSAPSISGMAAFGNTSFSSSIHKNQLLLSALSFIILKL